MNADGEVGAHGQEVSHCEPHEDGVGGRDHVSARQHDDVGHVGRDTPDAHDGCDVAVVVDVVLREVPQTRIPWGRRARCHARRNIGTDSGSQVDNDGRRTESVVVWKGALAVSHRHVCPTAEASRFWNKQTTSLVSQ